MGQAGIYVGIDVAKAKVDVAVRPTGERWEVPRDDAGIPQLVSELKTLGPSLVLLEATGGLELPLVAARAAEALPVVVVNPRQVRDFARATGKLAKTDARDAAVLAHFAEAIQPPVRPLRDAETQELNSLTARRQQVMTLLVSEKNRLGAATSAVRPRIAAHITWLEQDLNDLDQGRRPMLRQSPVWREKDDLLRTVPGVGEQLSLTLLANLPELGTLDRRQIADRRQLVLPVATTIFAGRYGVIIRYGGTVDYRPTNQAIEAETYGRQDTGNGSDQGWDERAFSAQVAERPIAVAGETGASVAHPSRPLRRGVGG